MTNENAARVALIRTELDRLRDHLLNLGVADMPAEKQPVYLGKIDGALGALAELEQMLP